MTMRRRDHHFNRRGRYRLVLGALALAALSAPAVSSGCAASFEPQNRVSSLRVLAVLTDKPYVKARHPGSPPDFMGDSEVTLKMEVYDGYDAGDGAGPRPVQIIWLGGCYDPPGAAPRRH